MVGVHVDLGDVIAFDAIADRDPVKPEDVLQDIDRARVADIDVNPDNGVRTFEEGRQVLHVVSLDTCVADRQHVHSAVTFLVDTGATPRRRPRRPMVEAYHAAQVSAWQVNGRAGVGLRPPGPRRHGHRGSACLSLTNVTLDRLERLRERRFVPERHVLSEKRAEEQVRCPAGSVAR